MEGKPSAPPPPTTTTEEYDVGDHPYQVDMERMIPLLAENRSLSSSSPTHQNIDTTDSTSSPSSTLSRPPTNKRIFRGHRHFSDTQKEEIVCRCCQGGMEDGDDFIAPCNCSGSIQFVHRHCLDTWRTVSTNPNSFYRCDICHMDYVFESEKLPSEKKWTMVFNYVKYACFVTMDISVIVILWQIMVLLCAVFVHLVDVDKVRMRKFTHLGTPVLAVDYLFGNLLFFFLLGLLGIFVGFAWSVMKCLGIGSGSSSSSSSSTSYESSSSSSSSYTYSTYPYRAYSHYRYSTWDYLALYFCWFHFYTPAPSYHHVDCCQLCCLPCLAMDGCTGCDCSGMRCDGAGCCDGGGCNLGDMKCDLGGSNDGGVVGVLLALLVIAVVIVICIGLFVGMGLAAYLLYQILNKRYNLIKRRDEVIQYVVADLETY